MIFEAGVQLLMQGFQEVRRFLRISMKLTYIYYVYIHWFIYKFMFYIHVVCFGKSRCFSNKFTHVDKSTPR